MSEHIAKQSVEKMTLEAVVIRADGTQEDLGVIAEYHRNPLRRLWASIRGVGKIRH